MELQQKVSIRNKLVLIMVKVIFFIGISLSFISCNDKQFRFEHTTGVQDEENSYTIDTFSYNEENGRAVLSISDFFNNVLAVNKNIEPTFEDSESFDWIKIINLKGILEARAVFDDYVYYSYVHDKLGVVYVFELSDNNIDEYRLLNHPEFDEKYVDSVVNNCTEFYNKVTQHIYAE